MSVFERYTGIQDILKECGGSGCNFLCLLSIAEEVNGGPVDLIDAYKKARASNSMDSSFYVYNNLRLLRELTGRNWLRREMSNIDGILSKNEYSIAVYFNPRTGRHHYRRRSFDTLFDSVTVKEGYIEKYYVYSHD